MQKRLMTGAKRVQNKAKNGSGYEGVAFGLGFGLKNEYKNYEFTAITMPTIYLLTKAYYYLYTTTFS